jgi:hypothetical protein
MPRSRSRCPRRAGSERARVLPARVARTATDDEDESADDEERFPRCELTYCLGVALIVTRFVEDLERLEQGRGNSRHPAPAMGAGARLAQRGAPRRTRDARIYHGDTKSAEASLRREFGVRSKAVPGRGSSGAEARVQQGEGQHGLPENKAAPEEPAITATDHGNGNGIRRKVMATEHGDGGPPRQLHAGRTGRRSRRRRA